MEGERARVGMLEACLSCAVGRVESSGGDRKHALADVGADNRAVRRDAGGQFSREKAWARPDVEHPLTWLGLKRQKHRLALGDNVRRAVDRLDAPRSLIVELQGCTHRTRNMSEPQGGRHSA